MKKLAILFVLLSSISYSLNLQQAKIYKNGVTKISTSQDPVNGNKFVVKDKDYQLLFNIEKDKGEKYFLIITVKLYNNSYYISPNATENATDKLNIGLGSYANITFDGTIIEIPDEFDRVSTTSVADDNYVHIATTYKIPLKINSEKDFEVFGKVEFYLNPRNTYEVAPFAISNKNGVLDLYSPKC